MEGTTSKSTVLPWAQKWPLLLQTFLWPTIVSQSVAVKPTVWKRYIDDIFPRWDACNLHDIERFIEQANSYNPTIKFMAEISNAETTFLDKVADKGNRFHHHSKLDIKTHSKPTETFCQYAHFSSSHPPGLKKGFVKGEALRLLRTNSSRTTFEKNIKKFKLRLACWRLPK